MRVCLVNFWDRGGMLHYAVQLANALAASVEVILILPRSTASGSLKLLDPAVRLELVEAMTDTSYHPARILGQFVEMAKFLRLVDSLKPDLVHVAAAHFWVIFTLPWISAFFPVVSTLHDVEPHPGSDDTLRKRLEIWTQRKFSRRVFVHAESLKAAFLKREKDRPGSDAIVIPHGDYAFFRQWEQTEVEEPGTVLFFGRIRRYKGLDVLLRAFPIVQVEVPAARLLIAGEGPLEEYEESIRGIDQCELHNGFIPDEAVGRFFQRASVVVCPYHEASQSGIVAVAYAYGKPVVATRVGGLEESVVHGSTGLLVEPGDAQGLADAIVRMLLDPGFRQVAGEQAFDRMTRRMDWRGIAARTVDAYREVLSETAS